MRNLDHPGDRHDRAGPSATSRHQPHRNARSRVQRHGTLTLMAGIDLLTVTSTPLSKSATAAASSSSFSSSSTPPILPDTAIEGHPRQPPPLIVSKETTAWLSLSLSALYLHFHAQHGSWLISSRASSPSWRARAPPPSGFLQTRTQERLMASSTTSITSQSFTPGRYKSVTRLTSIGGHISKTFY